MLEDTVNEQIAHPAYIFEEVLDGGLHPSVVFMCLAGMSGLIQPTREGLYAVWFPACIICSDFLSGLGVKECEERMYSYMQALE